MADFKTFIYFLIITISLTVRAYGETMPPDSDMVITIQECVDFALQNSFEIKMAKFDFYAKETDIMYSEAVFDTFFYGGASYEEDKSQSLSVFAATDAQTNEYYARIKKSIPLGTELSIEAKDTRLWTNNSAYVSKNPSHTAEVNLELTQPVGKNSFGYTDRLNVSMTNLLVKNADIETKDRIEAFIANVQKSYWDLVFRNRSLEIYRCILERAEKIYEADLKKYDMGMIEKADILLSEANAAKIRACLVIIENGRKKSEENLKLLMNFNAKNRIIPKEVLEYEHSEKDLEDCLKEAFKKRRDYQVKKRDVDIKGLKLKIKENSAWPEIDIVASLGLNSVEKKFNKAAGQTVTTDTPDYYAGIECKIPIENKEAKSETLKAKYEKEKAVFALKSLERSIVSEVVNAFNEVAAIEASLVYVKKAVELYETSLFEEEKRFNYGRSSVKDLISSQQDLLKNQIEEAESLLNYKKACIDLDRAMTR